MRKLLAIWTGKLLTVLGKLMGKRSSALPGEYAMKIYPDLIRDLRSHINKEIIVTCGTNGKTTTNNLLCSALEAKGYKVYCNRVGANMLSGVATVYINEANIFGKFKADYACLEIDEAYTRIVFDYVKPDVLVVTNLFRDQLDRYGETETTALIIKEAIAKCPSLKLILNADDPLCVQFADAKNVTATYCGVSEAVLPQSDSSKESQFCPVCGEKLGYNFHHYSQLGDFSCGKCGFARPKPDIEVTNVSLTPPMTFKINSQPVTVDFKGFYSIYNLISVYGALSVLGEITDDFASLLKNYKPQTGRMQEYKFKKPLILTLSKNPAGFNQAIATVNNDERKKDVIISVNDQAGDGRDVSWLWGVDFDKLHNENLNTLSTTGSRLWDVALRFKYADIIPDLVTTDVKEIVKKALDSDSEIVYLIANYTALYEAEKVLNDLLKEEGHEN